MVLLIAGCGKQEVTAPANPAPTNILATVENQIITAEAFQQELARRAKGFARNLSSAEQKQALLEEMIQFEATLAQARAAGYDRQPEVLAQFNRMVVNRFREDQLTSRQLAATPVDEAEIRAYYERHATNYLMPEMVRGAVLFLKSSPKATPEKKAALAGWAAQLLEQARQTNEAGFTQLIQQYSEDRATRYTGGDTGWLRRNAAEDAWNAGVRDALFALGAAGQFSRVITNTQGLCLVRLVEKKSAQTRSLAEAKEEIKYQITREREQQRQRDISEGMKRGLKITINRPMLDSLPAPVLNQQNKPPSGPSSRIH